MDSIRILIADDHPLFRDGLHGLLDSVPDTEVVGEAMDGQEAIALATSLQPDVILMDLKMPGVNGLQAMRERAAELGGVCRIEPGATGGTHVWARLPVPPPEV